MLPVDDETRWREALRAAGQSMVAATLAHYPGKPEDPVYNLALEPPYPPREFCQRWCEEQDSAGLSSITGTVAALLMVALLGVCVAAYSISGLMNPDTSTKKIAQQMSAPQASTSVSASGSSSQSSIVTQPAGAPQSPLIFPLPQPLAPALDPGSQSQTGSTGSSSSSSSQQR
jgi:hypothetical protein